MGDRRRSAEVVAGERAAKTCAGCGRTIEWRKKFEKNWDEVKFCSAGCRGHKPGIKDKALEEAILSLLAARGRDKTICPSEAARAVSAEVVAGERAAKTCAGCGRTIEWRKKFEKNWDEVKFCSAGCRGHKPGMRDKALEEAILSLLAARGRDKTICPSEAARAVSAEGWEELMEASRAAARRLVAAGKIVITQGGRVVDGSTAKGPIRLRLR